MGAQVHVIGGGIVGVCAALFLQREGFTVTLVEAGAVGEGTSFGNAGNISPGAVVPYLVPGILREAPKWLFDAEGPLKVRPGYFLKALPWFLAAVKHSGVENALKTSRAMRDLHRGTFDAYAQLTRGTPAEPLIDRCGQLYVSAHEGAAKGSQLAQFMREAAGVRAIPLDAAGVREAEPTLAPIYKSGLLLPDNGRVKNPHTLSTLLAKELERHGGTVLKGRVDKFETRGKHVVALVMEGRTTPVERLVIAAGMGSRKLAAALGIAVPLEAERGYHITVHDSNVMPRVTVTNRDLAFACAPMTVGLRVAGTAEFAGEGSKPDWSRAELLKRQAKKMFPALELGNVSQWAGDRPSFPDGLPALGAAPGYDNAYFAFGNGHFGITGGPVMGKYIAQIVAGKKPGVDVAPFDPARFESR